MQDYVTIFPSPSEREDVKKLKQSLEAARLERDELRGELREEEIATHDLCQILAIPSQNDFPEPKSEFERLLGPTLRLVETMATYSQKYWDMFKAVRNVFATA